MERSADARQAMLAKDGMIEKRIIKVRARRGEKYDTSRISYRRPKKGKA